MEIRRLNRSIAKMAPVDQITKRLERLEKRSKNSVKKRARRKVNRPELIYNDTLPIISKKDEIIDSISKNQVVIISGETGSGKTTQIPKFCLAAGRGIDGMIGCTQPRRIAATTVSRRIAEELKEELGRSVGYKIRFKDKIGSNTYIKIMTDGILLAETQRDPYLYAYDTIIVDEAHERSLNIDFILGFLKNLLKKRKDLKLVITSATIDTEKFSRAFYNAPIIEVTGRMFPVEIRYSPLDSNLDRESEQTHIDMAVQSVDTLMQESALGDILLFMPTEQDIRETRELLEGRNYAGTRIFPLFARLSAAEQSRVFSHLQDRKIIIATNIAETSLTIPGIKYVIDSGLARISQYNARSRTTSLPVTSISKSSADQRKGRCGRMEDGVCIRLFAEEDFETRPLFTSPEILRANLAEVILRMISLDLGDPADFPFIDPPTTQSIRDGFDLLAELGAIVPESDKKRSKGKTRFSLTNKGKLMAKMPIDPRLSRMLIEAQRKGCLEEVTVIASALSIQDPRERPTEKTEKADGVHQAFHNTSSDFITLLNIWGKYRQAWQKEKTTGRMKKFCRTHYLSFRRMREWRDIHAQISEILKEYGLNDIKTNLSKNLVRQGISSETPFVEDSPLYAAIHQSILSGFLSNISVKKEKNIFQAAKGKEVMIFPGSAIFNQAKKWVVAAEMVETSRLFARVCANINSDWLEQLGKDLCKYTYLEPHWERNRSEVVASEQVSLFGLIIVPQRPVSYGRINPEEAEDIFIQKALVEGDVKKKSAFMLHNQNLIEGVRGIEDKVRKRDLLVSEVELFEFYKQKLKGCYDLRTLNRRLKQEGNDRFLRMTPEDVFRYTPDDKELSLFPDKINIYDQSFDCKYKFRPGEKDDGLTVKIPSSSAPMVSPESLDWLVPGLYREKIAALIKSLPKTYRKQLVPLADTVDVVINEMPKVKGALVIALGNFIYSRFNVDIPASVWSNVTLPEHLNMRISITDARGQELYSSRDPAVLRRGVTSEADRDELSEIEHVRKHWEKTGMTGWDFPDLPDSIGIKREKFPGLLVYPGLQTAGNGKKGVNLRLFRHREEALRSHQEGVFLKKALALPKTFKKMADYFGGFSRFEKNLYKKIIHDLFQKNIRSKDAFYSHAESVAPLILPKGRELLNQSLSILESYHETRTVLFNLESTHAENSTVIEFLQLLREELARLVPETFVHLYDIGRIGRLLRYIKTVAIRAQRALINFEKDQVKANEIQFFVDSLNRLLDELSDSSSEEKRKAIEDYFWLIEEYKVSVFAQELKTAVPVSKKRLEKKLKEIERMG
jgi:ATP-dependent helicase HrpA